MLLSVGEQISVAKLSILLNELGYNTISLTGWQAGIYTNNVFQSAHIAHIDTTRILNELKSKKIVIVAGFQGINNNLDITTLGRGGSDTTAVALASALNAKCYIYSDIDGVYSADPKIINYAHKLHSLNYSEMLDMADGGAKVLHNRCVEIAKEYNIPIIAKSTFNNNIGTIINNEIEKTRIKSIVKNDNLFLVTIQTKSVKNCIKLFKKENIIPISINKNGLNSGLQVILKKIDYNKLNNLDLSNTGLQITTASNISSISIIGYSIYNSFFEIAYKLFNIIEDIYNIEITTGKIVITCNTIISNKTLIELHRSLIEKAVN